MIRRLYEWWHSKAGIEVRMVMCAFMAVWYCLRIVDVPPDSWRDAWSFGVFIIWFYWTWALWEQYRDRYLVESE